MIFNLDKLLGKRNVIGYSDEGDKVEVYVSKKYDTATAKRLINTESVDFWEKDLVPKTIRKWFKKKPTDVIELGEIKTQADRKKYRPLKGGCEIAIKNNPYVGTAGGVVYRKSYKGLKLYGRWEGFADLLERYGISYDVEPFILTNTHVALKYVDNAAGEDYVQPGGDSELINDGYAEAAYFSQDGDNYIDAAIIPLAVDMLSEQVPGWELNGVNTSPVLRMPVKKYGRTTEETHSEISRIGVTINVKHRGESYLFKDVIMVNNMSDAGDSGSMVLDEDNNIVGLIFAGNPNTSFIIPIDRVIKRFKLSTQY